MNLQIFSLVLSAVLCLLNTYIVFKVVSINKALKTLCDQREDNSENSSALDHRAILLTRLNEIQNKRFSKYF